jgi:hypothetical protein
VTQLDKGLLGKEVEGQSVLVGVGRTLWVELARQVLGADHVV